MSNAEDHTRSVRRTALVAALGLAPQTLMETLYYLTQVKPPPVPVAEIRILTTSTGKERVMETLLWKRAGRFHRFCEEYDIAPGKIRFGEEQITVLRDARGLPLEDIRTEEENALAADQTASFVRDLIADPKTALHCSVAGGRKTMGVYLACALQLFGRPQDVLSHVLVSPEFEGHPNFFYKPRRNRILQVRDSEGELIKQLHTDDARIELAEIPYLRLRRRTEGTLDVSVPYTQLVRQVQREMDLTLQIPDLVVDIRSRRLLVGSIEVALQPIQIALYALYARGKAEECLHPDRETCGECDACFVSLDDALSEESQVRMEEDYRVMYGSTRGQRSPESWRRSLEISNVRSYISKANGRIRKALDDPRLEAYFQVLPSSPQWGGTRYGIRLDRSKIHVR